MIYQVSAEAETNKVVFSCKTNCSKEIFKHGGDEMLEELYKDYVCPKSEYVQGFDVTIKIDTSGLPQTKKVKKTMDEETANKIREENEVIRVERSKISEAISHRVSEFKRNFLGAPIRQAMKAS